MEIKDIVSCSRVCLSFSLSRISSSATANPVLFDRESRPLRPRIPSPRESRPPNRESRVLREKNVHFRHHPWWCSVPWYEWGAKEEEGLHATVEPLWCWWRRGWRR